MTVVVVGDLLMDAVVSTDGKRQHASDTPARVRWRQGGGAASTARWLAHLGQQVRLISRVGDDAAGRMLRMELDAHGVDVSHVVSDPVRATGSVIALVHDGDRDMLTDRGASAALAPTDLRSTWLRGATHVHVSGYVLLDPRTRPAGLTAVADALAAGITVSVDPASRAPIERTGPEQVLRLLDGASTLLPNLDEAMALTGCPDASSAARALGARFGEAIVTEGRDGATWSDGGEVERLRSLMTVPEADPVGAGDAFAAGWLASRIIARATPSVALRDAAMVAAQAVSRSG